ncbi:MAG: dihydrodipicolinate synthase family protein [Thermoplasmata archaeon]
MSFHGLVVPLPTIFGADGTLDADGTAAFALSVAKGGADRLFVLGSLGEFPLLTREERREVVARTVAMARGSAPVWAGTGAPSTAEAIALSRDAESAGAEALVVVPPYYLHPAPGAIERYYRAIRRAVSVPLYAYNIPSLVGYPLDPSLVGRLGRDGVLAGIKDTSESLASVETFLRAGPEGFEVMPGDDALAAPAIARGAAGAVMGLANVLPRLGRAIVAAAHRGDGAEVVRLQELIEALAFVVAGGPFPSAGKFLASRVRGVRVGYRSPCDPLSPEEERRVLARWSAWDGRLKEFA